MPDQTEPAQAPATEAPAPPTAVPATDTPPPPPTATETPAVDVGSEVGQTPPAFAMTLADGSTVESASIIGAGKPAFMVYFATW